MTLFLSVISRTAGIVWTQDYLELAAEATFGNVIFLSLVCTAIDGIRRRIMVDRPVRQIINAAEQIMKGDFSV